MKTLIVYATRHGCTKTCAEKIRSVLPRGADLVTIKESGDIALEAYDAVAIGGSIHAGRIQGSVKKFCDRRQDVLLKKKVGLFLCCMEEGEKAKKEFEDNFPQALRNHASAKGIFGGAFDFDRMNFLERAIVKKVAGVRNSVSKISDQAIAEFVGKMKT